MPWLRLSCFLSDAICAPLRLELGLSAPSLGRDLFVGEIIIAEVFISSSSSQWFISCWMSYSCVRTSFEAIFSASSRSLRRPLGTFLIYDVIIFVLFLEAILFTLLSDY